MPKSKKTRGKTLRHAPLNKDEAILVTVYLLIDVLAAVGCYFTVVA